MRSKDGIGEGQSLTIGLDQIEADTVGGRATTGLAEIAFGEIERRHAGAALASTTDAMP